MRRKYLVLTKLVDLEWNFLPIIRNYKTLSAIVDGLWAAVFLAGKSKNKVIRIG